MRIAIIHDYLNQYGGAERVLETLLEIWPEAEVYTLLLDKTRIPPELHERSIRRSFLNKFPFARLYYEFLLPLYPLAVESIDTRKYDMVISNSSAWAKGAVTNIDTCHISYCLNPMRFVWDSYFSHINHRGLLTKGLKAVLHYLRIWDITSSDRPDYYITISEFVRNRIKKYYGKDAEIIHPPVDTGFFLPDSSKRQEEYFLVVSRLRPYKRIDLAIKAFNELKLPLVIIGDGSNRSELYAMAERNVQFLGSVDDKTLLSYYQRCRAVIFPQTEDFGIVPLEAQSCGKPVIAYRSGGAKETVIDGKTGVFFDKQSAESLKDAVNRFNSMKFDPDEIRRNALLFSKDEFKRKFKESVLKYIDEYRRKNGII